MPALAAEGISNEQFLAVWSTNGDTGFTSDQLLAAGVPGYLIFNEVCNTPLSSGPPVVTTNVVISTNDGMIVTNVSTINGPTIRLLSTNLSPTNTQVMLETKTYSTAVFSLRTLPPLNSENVRQFAHLFDNPGETRMLENVEFLYLRDDGLFLVCTVSVPLSQVFSNLTVFVTDANGITANIQLCPGR